MKLKKKPNNKNGFNKTAGINTQMTAKVPEILYKVVNQTSVQMKAESDQQLPQKVESSKPSEDIISTVLEDTKVIETSLGWVESSPSSKIGAAIIPDQTETNSVGNFISHADPKKIFAENSSIGSLESKGNVSPTLGSITPRAASSDVSTTANPGIMTIASGKPTGLLSSNPLSNFDTTSTPLKASLDLNTSTTHSNETASTNTDLTKSSTTNKLEITNSTLTANVTDGITSNTAMLKISATTMTTSSSNTRSTTTSITPSTERTKGYTTATTRAAQV